MGKTLAVGLGLVLFISLSIGLLASLVYWSALRKKDQLHADHIQIVSLMMKSRSEFDRCVIALREFLLSGNTAFIDRLDIERRALDGHLALVDAKITSDEAKAVFREIQTEKDAYRLIVNQAIDLKKKGVLTRMDPFILRKLVPKLVAVENSIQDLLAVKTLQALDRQKKSREASIFALKVSSSLIVLLLIAGSVIAYLVAHEVRRAHTQLEELSIEQQKSLSLIDNWLASSPNGMAFLDRELRHIRVNDALASMSGRDIESLLGRTLREVAVPEMVAIAEPVLREVLQTGKPVGGIEISSSVGSRPGGPRDWLTNFFPIRANEEIVGAGVVVTEITERKRVEGDLKRVSEELRRSNQALDLFATAAAHDLREPLRMISSFLKLLHNRYGSVWDKDALEYFGFALDGSQRMKRMIDELLRYSQIMSSAIMKKPIACQEMFDKAITDLKELIDESGAKIQIRAPNVIKGEEELLIEVFRSLIGNAIRFRRQDGCAEVRVDYQMINTEVLFSVADNGVGFDARDAENIFRPFRQLYGSAYRESGIGLATCKGIIQCHGGRIWAERGSESGAVFYVAIPDGATGLSS